MPYHEVPRAAQEVSNVSLMMRAGSLGRLEVARYRVVPTSEEGVSHEAAVLARN
jgi:hypothetical protein